MDNGQGTGMETPCQKDFQKPMRKFLTLKLFLIFENLFGFSAMGEGAGFMPASRRRSISPPTQLRKADLGTWHSDRSFRFAVRVKSVSRPCKVRVDCG